MRWFIGWFVNPVPACGFPLGTALFMSQPHSTSHRTGPNTPTGPHRVLIHFASPIPLSTNLTTHTIQSTYLAAGPLLRFLAPSPCPSTPAAAPPPCGTKTPLSSSTRLFLPATCRAALRFAASFLTPTATCCLNSSNGSANSRAGSPSICAAGRRSVILIDGVWVCAAANMSWCCVSGCVHGE